MDGKGNTSLTISSHPSRPVSSSCGRARRSALRNSSACFLGTGLLALRLLSFSADRLPLASFLLKTKSISSRSQKNLRSLCGMCMQSARAKGGIHEECSWEGVGSRRGKGGGVLGCCLV